MLRFSTLALSVLFAFRAAAQIGGAGSIQGTITDPTGAVVPSAPVTAANIATGVVTARQSTTAGVYVMSPLPAGEYTVTVSAPGFQTAVQQHVIVDALSVIGLNFALRVGSTNEQVTVSDTPPQLNTDD